MKEHCFGVIPLQQREQWYVLMIQHKDGHWGLPKGKQELQDLSEQATALRELREETGLWVTQWIVMPPLQEHYTYQNHDQQVHKTVTYFPAYVEGEVHIQASELQEARWCTLDQAIFQATFPEMKCVLEEIRQALF